MIKPLIFVSTWKIKEGRLEDYKQFAREFNPVNYDADAWVRMAKDAGMKYIVITSNHLYIVP